ncbi:PREDICTED: serine protease gd-like [Polistes canadensis]|uniref:serine protease gd-like n=1 Tax=Polistes canadensis TaxID=91411 RepID=UPI000718D1CC|nr:PREDICTED: serine protease gd-like [Polistes canadensis]
MVPKEEEEEGTPQSPSSPTFNKMFYDSIGRLISLIYLSILLSCKVSAVQSPCPNYFRYFWNNRREIIGQVIISSPPKNTDLHLKIELSLAALLPSKYIGQLALARSKEETVREIQQGRPLFYVVNFPVTEPLPVLTNLWFNGQLYCSGPRASGRIVTSISLEHTLFPPKALLTSANSANNHDERPNFNNFILSFNQPEQPYLEPEPLQPSMPPPSQPYLEYKPLQPSMLPPSQPYLEYKPLQQPSRPYFEPKPLQPSRPYFDLKPLQQSSRPYFEPKPLQQSSRPYFEPKPLQQPSRPYLKPKPLQSSMPLPLRKPPLSSSSSSLKPNNYEQCGKENSNLLVAGGVETEPNQWPWLVAIFFADLNLEFQCAGTLVTNKHIITAAHCTRRSPDKLVLPAGTISVSLGHYSLWDERKEGSIRRGIKEYKVHPDYDHYDQSADADLAVMILLETVEFSESIKPICLWTGSDDLRDIVGYNGYVIGWGKNERDQISNEPRLVVVPIVSQEDCLRSNQAFLELTSNRTLCAGSRNGIGPCNGDSGSGLVIRRNDGRYYLRAVVSRSILDFSMSCDLNNYIVYVDLMKYRDWIRLQISS